MKQAWLIYGANGYSGKLIALESVKNGLKPVLAGRNETAINRLAEELGLSARVFSLDSVENVAKNLQDVAGVIHCAGPFSSTSRAMIEACLQSKTHYFDITGEIDVFEYAHSQGVSSRAREQGVVICPGVGFDVVPTDCIAAMLVDKLPDATELDLGFYSRSPMSPGTAKTMVEGMKQGVRRRVNGTIVKTGLKTKDISFGKGARTCMLLSWGDVSTAFYTTEVPNISVYIPASSKTIFTVKAFSLFKPVFFIPGVEAWLKGRAAQRKGPSDEARAQLTTRVWGEVRNKKGESYNMLMETANGYAVTAEAPVAIMKHYEKQGFTAFGSKTPSQLMGKDFVLQLRNTRVLES